MKKKVVIIGGGFAGSHVAKCLDKIFDVTLIDTKDYFEFTPGILRTLVDPMHVRNIQVLHTHYLRWARVIVGKVTEVSEKYVTLKGKKIKFDYLVIASGSTYNAPFKEQTVVIATRARHLRNIYGKLCEAKKVVIIGGGLVGVELAGEICWRYKKEKKIMIVHAADRLIERNNKKAIRYAENYLKKKGVKIFFNEKVVNVEGGICKTDKGRLIKADIIFLCTGITPNYGFMKEKYKNLLNERGQIKVNDCLQVYNKTNIFAIGDISDVMEEKTAQNAERQAETIYRNICNLAKGKKLESYKTKRTPLIISLGKKFGIYSGANLVFSGWIPGFMKRVVERWEMYKKRKVN